MSSNEMNNHYRPLETCYPRLEKFWLYETSTAYYLIGLNDSETAYRCIKIQRNVVKPKDLSEILYEDPLVYSAKEIADVLDMIHEGHRSSGGLTKICSAFGLAGFVRFLDGYYLILVTQRKEVGCIAGNMIYTIRATEIFPIRPKDELESNPFRSMWKSLNKRLTQTTSEIAENRYLGLFQFVDMTKDFFFSYSYDLTRTLQYNYAATRKASPIEPQEMFEWNHYLIDELRSIVGAASASLWITPLVHGSYQQKRFWILGRSLDLILVARRSRHYAGTRYLKRGISVTGKVANDCEVEQIMQYDDGSELKFCSYTQMRGSIPTYWHQETSVTMPKPPILLNRIDPDYLATQEHFADLFRRYGSPVIVLDLVKQHEKRARESIVGREFKSAIEVLNESIVVEHKIRYVALDYSKITSISKGKYSKAKPKSSSMGGFLYGKKDVVAKERATAAIGDEWTLMEKSLVKNIRSGIDATDPNLDSSKKDTIVLPQLDQTRTDYSRLSALNTGKGSGSNTGVNQASGLNVSKSSGLYDNWEDVTAVESKIDVLRELEDIANLSIHETGFFSNTTQYIDRLKNIISSSRYDYGLRSGCLVQSGVLRTNCIDCLDRTNGGQFAVAMRFLSISLSTFGLRSVTDQAPDPGKDPMLLSLMEMYGEMADRIALQYGGSEAHRKVLAGKAVQSSSSSKQNELLTSIKRYYSNAFTDMVKQDAMNVFLGCFVPNESAIPLWDLESDFNLHNPSLHPPIPAVYRVLYDIAPRDGLLLKESKLKAKLESAIKKTLTDVVDLRSPSTTVGSNAPAPTDIMSADLSQLSGDVDQLEAAKEVSPLHESMTSPVRKMLDGFQLSRINWGELLKRYYIKQISQSGGGSVMANLASRKARNVINHAVRALARMERRKLMRLLASKRIAASSELWWVDAIIFYNQTIYEGNIGEQELNDKANAVKKIQDGDRQLPCESYFDRFYKPHEITEFDNMLTLDFFIPTEVVDMEIKRKMKNTVPSISTEDDDSLKGEDSVKEETTANKENPSGANFLSTLFTYPMYLTTPTAATATAASTLSDSIVNVDSHHQPGIPTANNVILVRGTPPNSSFPRPTGYPVALAPIVEEDDVRSSSHDPGANSTISDLHNAAQNTSHQTSTGFQLTRYVREIGIKAGRLVGGLLRKDDTSNAANVATKVNDESTALGVGDGGFWNPLITQLHAHVPKSSKMLYAKYAATSRDHLLLAQPVGHISYTRKEYENLLHDVNVDVDDVRGLEQLAAESYICRKITRGIYEGLPQDFPASLAHQFLFNSLVQVENDMANYGAFIDQTKRDSSAFHTTSYALPSGHRGKALSDVSPPQTVDNAALSHPHSPPSLSLSPIDSRVISSELSNQLQEHVSRTISRARAAEGLKIELKRLVNVFIHQQHCYSREINPERLARRSCSFLNEAVVLHYASQFDTDIVASEWEMIGYLLKDHAHYSRFRDLAELLKKLYPIRRAIEERRRGNKEEDGDLGASNKDTSVMQLSDKALLEMRFKRLVQRRKKKMMGMKEKSTTKSTVSPSKLQPSLVADGDSSSKDGISTHSQQASPVAEEDVGSGSKKISHDSTSITKHKLVNDIEGDLVTLLNSDIQLEYERIVSNSWDYSNIFPYNQDHHGVVAGEITEGGYALHGMSNIAHEYIGFRQLAPDLYSRLTNPHLQMNEIGVIRFNESLGISATQPLKLVL